MKILVVPTTDWLGHPFPSRLHHIFERIAEHNEVHVLRFAFYPQKRLETRTIVHEIPQAKTNNLAAYYIVNSLEQFRAIRRIVRENKIDVVVISNLLAGYIAAKATGNLARKVFDLSDYFPTSGAGYYFNTESAAGKFVTAALADLLKITLKTVDLTVTCSQTLMQQAKKWGIRNVHVVPNGVDEFFCSHNSHAAKLIKEKYALKGYVTIGYIGSIEFWLDLLPLLQAIKKLKKDNQVKLFIIGSKLRTNTAKTSQAQIKALGIENEVVWLDHFVPYKEVPHYMAAMDICTIPFNLSHPTAYYSAPNKLWEYLALGKAVITTPINDAINEARQFVDVAVTSRDYQRIIQEYIKAPDKFRKKAKAAEKLVRTKTWDKIAESYEHLLKSIV